MIGRLLGYRKIQEQAMLLSIFIFKLEQSRQKIY